MIKRETVLKKLTNEYQLLEITDTHVIYKHLPCGTVTSKKFGTFKTNPFCKNKDCINKRKIANSMAKYGVEHPFQSFLVKEKIEKTSLKRYGHKSPNSSETVKKHKLKKIQDTYGVSNVSQLNSVKEKIKKSMAIKWDDISFKRMKTNIKRYGVKSPSQLDSVKDKIRKTNLSVRGVEYPMQCPEVRKRSKNTSRKKYGTDYPMQSEKVLQKIWNKSQSKILKNLENSGYEFLGVFRGTRHLQKYIYYEIKHIACGTIFKDDVFKIPRCPKCFKESGRSQLEEKWYQFIKEKIK